MEGGKALGSGSFGCIFSPALPCKGSPRDPKAVSKLMNESAAHEEYYETALVRVMKEGMPPALRTYFIIPNGPPCEVDVAKLKKNDLDDAGRKCRNFTEIVRTSLKRQLPKLRVLQQLNGGEEVSKVIRANFPSVTGALARLLHVVRQMNLRGIVHGDLKGVNIVYDASDNTARLIDWGFSHPLQSDYCNTTWSVFGYVPFMFNCLPSMWVYAHFLETPVGDLSKYTEFVHAKLVSIARQGSINHLSRTDVLFSKINYLLTRHGVSPFLYADPVSASGTKLGPIPGISQETTNILVAHAVTAMVQWGDDKSRFLQMADLVLRANNDIYGVLTCLIDLVEEPRSTARDMVILALAPFYLSVEFAIKPYDVNVLHDIFTQLASSWSTPQLAPWKRWCSEQATKSELFVFDYNKAVNVVDPSELRVFPSIDFEGGPGVTIPVLYPTRDTLAAQVSAGNARFASVFAPGAAPPAGPATRRAGVPGAAAAAARVETPFFTPEEQFFTPDAKAEVAVVRGPVAPVGVKRTMAERKSMRRVRPRGLNVAGGAYSPSAAHLSGGALLSMALNQ